MTNRKRLTVLGPGYPGHHASSILAACRLREPSLQPSQPEDISRI